MKTVKIKGLENPEIKCKDYDKPKFTHPVFQPYCRVSITGSSGTGKSNAFINLFDKMYPQLDRVYICSGSLYNDPKQCQAFLNKDRVMVFSDPSITVLGDIIRMIEEMNNDHQEYLKFKKVYDKWIHSGMEDSVLRPKELVLLYKYNFDPDNLNYTKTTRPNQLVFLDDLQGLDILKHKVFENFIIKARHKNTNVFLTTQTWKGVSPVWRRNCSGYMIFKTIDMNQLKDIFEEIQGLFKSYDQFLELYNHATEEKHEFLYVDMNDKHAPLRKNFNEIMVGVTPP